VSAALVLDIDGVLIYERSGPEREILLLHSNLDEALRRAGCPVYLLTHRSRAETNEILAVLGLDRASYQYCFTASDILWAALRSGRFTALMKGGLRKSLILPTLQTKYGLSPADICFVDDTLGNVADMQMHGVGHVLHAPSSMDSGTITTFDFEEVLSLSDVWRAESNPATRSLTPVRRELGPWCRTGSNSRLSARTLFNRLRRSLRAVRKQFESAQKQQP
jgi:hypothetical protein